jgi:hypothetical protein
VIVTVLAVVTVAYACAVGHQTLGGNGLCGSTPRKTFYRGTTAYDADETSDFRGKDFVSKARDSLLISALVFIYQSQKQWRQYLQHSKERTVSRL